MTFFDRFSYLLKSIKRHGHTGLSIGISHTISLTAVSLYRGEFRILSTMMSSIANGLFYSVVGVPGKTNVENIFPITITSPIVSFISCLPRLALYSSEKQREHELCIDLKNIVTSIALTIAFIQLINKSMDIYYQHKHDHYYNSILKKYIDELAIFYDTHYSKLKTKPSVDNEELNIIINKLKTFINESYAPLRLINHAGKNCDINSYFLKDSINLKKYIYSEGIARFIKNIITDIQTNQPIQTTIKRTCFKQPLL